MTTRTWIIGIALALGLAVSPSCSKSDDGDKKADDKSAGDTAKSKSDEAPAAKDKAKDKAKDDTKASSEEESDSCPGVCKRCYEAVIDGCKECADDRDCDSPEDPCMTAKMLEKQFGCGSCASSLGHETTTDDCKDD